MATKESKGTGRSSAQSRNGRAQMNARRRAAKKRNRIIIFSVEIVLLLVMVGVLYFVTKKTEDGPVHVEIGTNSEIGIESQVDEDPVMKGYWNIALFGVDAVNEDQLVKGARSDTIMIASINQDTGDIKLVSVYRDTYLNRGNDDYDKCNGAYMKGGGEQAVTMLNSNLDMDINDFVAVGYEGLIEVVDGLGGIYVDVSETELLHINNYQITIVKDYDMDQSEYKPVKKAGYQLLNGLQVAGYCRIRYIKGDDFGRAANQREVLMAIEEQAKKADLATLTNVFTEAMKHVVTTLKTEDLLPRLSEIGNYRIVDEAGFPEDSMRGTGNIGSKGSCVVPLDLESNVVWLHQFLFDDMEYTVSDRVAEYGRKIKADTEKYLQK